MEVQYNSNIRCIEILNSATSLQKTAMYNSNIRCIEIKYQERTTPNHKRITVTLDVLK